MASTKRDQLIDTAVDLFYAEGFHAVGIDRVVAAAGVAKKTLYNHFRSKDELILAALRRRDEQFRNWFVRSVEGRAETAADRLLALFDALDEWFGDRRFSGCMFINASAEYADATDSIRRASADHKRLIETYIRGLASEAGASDPGELAAQLSILLDGAIVARYTAGRENAAGRAKMMARTIIDNA